MINVGRVSGFISAYRVIQAIHIGSDTFHQIPGTNGTPQQPVRSRCTSDVNCYSDPYFRVREQQLVAIVVLGCHGDSCLNTEQSTRIHLRELLDQIPGTNGTPQQPVRARAAVRRSNGRIMVLASLLAEVENKNPRPKRGVLITELNQSN
jgi:hypothetical protein